MPPVIETRLPAMAKALTISAIAAPQITNASGAAAPSSRDNSAGNRKIPAPTVVLTMLAAT